MPRSRRPREQCAWPNVAGAQEDVKRRREVPPILKHSGVGNSQANEVAGRVVQPLGSQVRVLRQRLETRLGIRVRGAHPTVSWMAEHVADILSNNGVGLDGEAEYERMKGAACSHAIVESGDTFHRKYPNGSRR